MDNVASVDEYNLLLNRSIGICKVFVQNGVPSKYKVKIIAAGVKFFYRDGGTYQDGPVALDLDYKEEELFDNNDADKCVHQVLAVITVQQAGFKPTIFKATQNAAKDKCLLRTRLTLGFKSDIGQDRVESKNLTLEDVLELTFD